MNAIWWENAAGKKLMQCNNGGKYCNRWRKRMQLAKLLMQWWEMNAIGDGNECNS